VAPAAIEFDHVSCGYDGRRVLADVSLRLAAGESLALVGPSGAGKSTLLKLVNRLLLPGAGAVRVDGRDTRAWDPVELRRRTGYVLQHIALFPHRTVAENIALVPRLLGWDERRRMARARELLEVVGLPAAEYAERLPDELSGGQQQRVGVARALAASPPVLLLDEPFGALDAVTRRDLQILVRRLHAELRPTMLIVTHDLAEAAVLGERIAVLDAGALVACDTPAVVRESTDPRVRRLLDAAVAT
jgi:osmoprotectant transport system ATP-binding protein